MDRRLEGVAFPSVLQDNRDRPSFKYPPTGHKVLWCQSWLRVSALSDFSDAVEGCLGAWEQKSPILGRNDGPVLGAPGPPMGACIKPHLLQGGVHLLPCMGTQISLTSYRFTHVPPLSGSLARPSSLPGHTPPHLSQKVCRQGRTLGHRYRSRQMLHTRNCLSMGWTSGPGLSCLFAMVPTDGSRHSHQPVYGEMVSTGEVSTPSPT